MTLDLKAKVTQPYRGQGPTRETEPTGDMCGNVVQGVGGAGEWSLSSVGRASGKGGLTLWGRGGAAVLNPQVGFILHQGNLSWALRAFQLIRLALPRLSGITYFT